jgi:hypothetical protein
MNRRTRRAVGAVVAADPFALFSVTLEDLRYDALLDHLTSLSGQQVVVGLGGLLPSGPTLTAEIRGQLRPAPADFIPTRVLEEDHGLAPPIFTVGEGKPPAVPYIVVSRPLFGGAWWLDRAAGEVAAALGGAVVTIKPREELNRAA